MERLGRYEIVAHLAQGGMGRVSLGVAIGPGGFERHVILKTLDLEGTGEEEATAMFLDEARLLGMLHHQHVATIHEVSVDDEGRLFLVLEYVHGHTAHDVWERALDMGVELPLDFTITVVTAAASGLHYAHTRRAPDGKHLRIVHRDVTLSNLMIGFDGSIKVIDFGIAKAAVRSSRTQAGFVKGKVGYMAPEQLRGQAVDARTDVFALGIVLYELTTMRRAFRQGSDRATVERIKNGTLVKPSEAIEGYPRDLEEIVLKALSTDPAQRFQDADALRRELESLGHRYRLVLGDAAVSEVLNQLFTDQVEPWQARATSRAEGEVEIPIDDDVTKPTTMSRELRAETSPAELLVIAMADEGTTVPVPPRPTPRAGTVVGSGIEPRVPSDSNPPPVSPISDLSGEVVSIPLPRPASPDPRETAVTRRKTWRAWAGLAVAAGVLGGGAAGAVYTFQNTAQSAPASAASTLPPPAPAVQRAPLRTSSAQAAAPVVAPPPAPAPAPPPPPTAPTSVTLAIETLPTDATVLLDGQRLGHTPYRATVDATPGTHVLKIRHRGCVTKKLEIELTADLTQTIELTPLADDAGAECAR